MRFLKFLIWSGRRDSNSRPLVPELTKYNFIAIYRELGDAEKVLAICVSRYYALKSLNWFYKFLKNIGQILDKKQLILTIKSVKIKIPIKLFAINIVPISVLPHTSIRPVAAPAPLSYPIWHITSKLLCGNLML